MSAGRTEPARRPRAAAIVAGALVFGVLWGVAEALWLVAPTLVERHHLAPRTLAHWGALATILVAMSVTIAVVLSFVPAVIVLAWQAIRTRPYRRPELVLALAPGPLMPLAYLILCMVIEAVFFRRTMSAPSTAGILLGISALWLALRTTYERVAHRPPYASPRSVAIALALCAMLGIVGLRVRYKPPRPTAASDARPLGARDASDPTPLLFVGLDSGNWQTIRPLMEAGRLPVLTHLMATGVHGTVTGLWPPYWSGPAWAAIVTGHPREETGVFSDLVVDAPGLPPFNAPLPDEPLLNPFFYVEWRLLRADLVALTPPPRAALGRPPFWESLHRAGVDTAVIRFDFTEPPDDQATIVVSSRVGADTWEVVGVKSESAEVFAPPELETDLARLFSPTTSADATLPPRIARTTARPPGRNGDLELQMLRTGLDIDQRSFAAARFVVTRRPQTEVLALYLGGFDGVCHAFWPYRFPEAYGADAPGSDAVAAFGGVIDHYLEYLDQELGALLAVYRVPPNVILVSDHGHTASTENPLWRGWHGREGLFIAGGPAFVHREDPMTVSYFEVVPTIFDVLGFAVPDGLHGSSRRQR